MTNFWHIFHQEISPTLSLQHQDRFRQTTPQPLWRLLRQLTGLLTAPRACRWKTCPGFPWQPCKHNDVLFNKPFLLSLTRPCSVSVDSYPAVVYPLIWLRVPDPGQRIRKSLVYLLCCLTAIRGGDHYLWRNAQHWLYFNQLNHFPDSHATKSYENKFAGKIRSFLNHARFIYAIPFPYFCQRNREIISSCRQQALSKWGWESAQGFYPAGIVLFLQMALKSAFLCASWPVVRLFQ